MDKYIENNICRICLSENNEEIQLIFNTNDSTGRPLQFAEIIMTFTTIQVTSGDGLPDQICSKCAQDAIKTYLFKLKCEDSDKRLRSRLKKPPLMVIEKIEVDEEDIFNRTIKTEIKDEIVAESDSGGGYCAGRQSENYLETSPENKFLLYQKIPKSEDNNKALHQCDVCKKKYSSPLALISHKNSKHSYECDVCEKTFSSPWALTKHRRIHSGEKPFECDVCEKKFTQSGALLTHKRTHTGEKPYECEICKKKFSVSSALINHKRVHTGEKPYECNICEKKFIESGLLIRHKRTHTGEKPYECHICEKKFSASWALISHKRTHGDNESFKCEACVKTFSTAETLIRHKRDEHANAEEME